MHLLEKCCGKIKTRFFILTEHHLVNAGTSQVSCIITPIVCQASSSVNQY